MYCCCKHRRPLRPCNDGHARGVCASLQQIAGGHVRQAVYETSIVGHTPHVPSGALLDHQSTANGIIHTGVCFTKRKNQKMTHFGHASVPTARSLL